MTIKTGNDVAADQSRFIRGPARGRSHIEGHATVAGFEPIHAEVEPAGGKGDGRPPSFPIPAEEAHKAATGEKQSQQNPHPGHAAKAQTTTATRVTRGVLLRHRPAH